MRVFASQIYIRPGIEYPFSHHFQKWLGSELTHRVKPSAAFIQTYAEDFDLILRISAKSQITEPEIKGPTVFKRDKQVEFTIFLPHSGSTSLGPNGYARPLENLFDGIEKVLQVIGVDASEVAKSSSELIRHVLSEPAMIEE